ncbi:hypothetical protein HMPREF2893_01390 [Streptococcus sp. HMSC072C09]|nr:hypothetical protein HMPREF2893_01390 [Streptococcus sp. HMSC072C09]
MSLDNVHIPMRANRILSIAQINGKLEIAILGEKFFVTDSYWSDPKHLAKYTEKEFHDRSEALAYRESLGLNGIIEVYCREVSK